MDFASIAPYINTALSFAAGAWAGPYLGGYARKKGENLATHEDIGKVTKQVAAVTTTTEQIKTEISDESWGRQRRWELKREVLIEASKRKSLLRRCDHRVTFRNGCCKLGKQERRPSICWHGAPGYVGWLSPLSVAFVR
jgi:hypothetical protein